MRVTAMGNGEAQTGYDAKRNGVVKVHALVAPLLGMGRMGYSCYFRASAFSS